jgi:hypothetical protein
MLKREMVVVIASVRNIVYISQDRYVHTPGREAVKDPF